MRLVIAEKHSVAQAIGQTLGDAESHDGYVTRRAGPDLTGPKRPRTARKEEK